MEDSVDGRSAFLVAIALKRSIQVIVNLVMLYHFIVVVKLIVHRALAS